MRDQIDQPKARKANQADVWPCDADNHAFVFRGVRDRWV